MPTRININDSMYFPVQALLNAVSDSSFVDFVDCLTRGIGFSSNDADCTFPGDLDPDEIPFEGVRFSLFEDEVVVSLDQLREYLTIACNSYIATHPESECNLNNYLSRGRTE